MKLLHVVPTFYPATYFGGPVFSVFGLCNALASTGRVDLRVLTTDSSGPARQDRLAVAGFPVQRPEGYEIYYCRKWWGKGFSPPLLWKMYSLIRWADVIHLTSVYSFPTIPALILCRLLRKPVVWSPRGQLQRWPGSRKVLTKRIWAGVCNGLLNPERSVLHVTSREEADESRLLIDRAETEIAENGVDIPPEPTERSWRPAGALRLLFIGRLDPKKGLENLIQAMTLLDDHVSLVVCGCGEPVYEASLRSLVSRQGLESRVRFLGHVEGEEKSRAFWNSDICIVPSFTENFAMVVAEALAHGVPVIASTGTPWQRLQQMQCGDWVTNDPESLKRAISRLGVADLRQMGSRGRKWILQEYSWKGQAERIIELYATLHGTVV